MSKDFWRISSFDTLDNVFGTNILLGNIRLALSVDSITTCLPVIKSVYK